MPSRKSTSDAAPGKLATKILEHIDLDKLSESVAQQVGERILADFAISDLVDTLVQKYQHELQAQITQAIVDRL